LFPQFPVLFDENGASDFSNESERSDDEILTCRVRTSSFQEFLCEIALRDITHKEKNLEL
jgi:hypothetical protein